MDNLPFYIPDYELKLRLGKLLVLFQVLSVGRKPILLNHEKIGQFEFLIKHPILLQKILNDKSGHAITIKKSEMYSIEALFHNRAELFDYGKIKALLKILISYEYLDTTIVNYQAYYSISNIGQLKATELEVPYYERIRNIYTEMKPLVLMPSSKICLLIELNMSNGVKNKNT